MPISLLSNKELEQLFTCIIVPARGDALDSLLSECHEWKTYGSLMSYERFFHKRLGYRDFAIHIRRVIISDSTVHEADIQFKRTSIFPAPYLNRNRGLVRELRILFDHFYEGQETQVEKDGRGRKIHYKARLTHVNFDNLLEWVGECTLIDEPHSSGQTAEDMTDIRNDFVIVRFNRDFA